MTNLEVRQWYLSQVGKIPILNEGWTRVGLSAEQRARRAWQVRHDARQMAREMMEDQREVILLRDRDLGLYGNTDGPTFEFLTAKASKLGLEGDKMYDAIVAGSVITNADTDKEFRASLE